MKINDIAECVYLLNLDRRSDRMSLAAEELSKNDIEYVRFSAVDGNKIDLHPKLGRGAAGCLESHLSIIKKSLHEKKSCIAIIEDDAFFVENFQSKFENYMHQVPDDWQFAYLANNKVQAQVSRVSENVERVSNAWSTHAFLIRSVAMELTLHLAEDGNYPIDVCYGKIQEFVPAYTAVPSLAGQRADYSDIENVFIDYNIIYGL